MEESGVSFVSDMINALYHAHYLVESYLRGEPVDTNRLENYYNDIFYALRSTKVNGSLISEALRELSEATGDKFDDLLVPEEDERSAPENGTASSPQTSPEANAK